MKHCPHCGVQVEEHAKFCGGCGQSLAVTQSPAAPPQKKKRKVWLPVLIVVLVAAIGVGGFFAWKYLMPGGTPGSVGSGITPPAPPASDAPAHEQLYYQSETMLGYARHAADMGVTLQAEYFYGLALAPVSSLRFCAENILWLKGEGETLEDIVKAAPYGTWDDIVGAGPGSPMPFYFEGLLYQVQGKETEAADCYKKAKANPIYEKPDFYYLKSMSVEELYALRDACVEKELAILNEYTPRTVLYAPRTGAEFSPVYHGALANEMLTAGDGFAAHGCLLNAVLANPQIPDYYAPAILMGLEIGNADTAALLANEGLWAFPENGEINYAAATLAMASGDTAGAKAYLQTAKADAELSAAFSEQCDQLLSQIGG